jgi:hypothetical protein
MGKRRSEAEVGTKIFFEEKIRKANIADKIMAVVIKMAFLVMIKHRFI